MPMARGRSRDRDGDEDPGVGIFACETRPGRVVFTGDDSTDAWIATDLTVEVER